MGKIDGQLDERSLTLLGEARRALEVAKRELAFSPFVGKAARHIVSARDALEQSDAWQSNYGKMAGSSVERDHWQESLARVEALARTSEEGGEREPPDPLALLDLRDQIDWLSRELVACDGVAAAKGRGWSARLRRPSLPAMMCLLAAGALGIAALAGEPARSRPWRAAFYDTLDFSHSAGQPVIRRQVDLDFYWGRRSPVPGVGADSFSVRWDSCLEVSETAATSAGRVPLELRLRSDDDARLWLDGRMLLVGSGRGGQKERSAEASLSPGSHHLRVEYRDLRGTAAISLEIESLARKARGKVAEAALGSPLDWLEFPPQPFDFGDPCRLAGGDSSR